MINDNTAEGFARLNTLENIQRTIKEIQEQISAAVARHNTDLAKDKEAMLIIWREALRIKIGGAPRR